MLTINPALYERLAELLIEVIGGRRYISESISFEDEATDYIFSSTLIIHFRETINPEGAYEEISSIVPVWWEMHSITEDGEQLNDFDFNLLKQIVCR